MNKDTKRLLDLISSIDPKGLFGNSSLKFITIAIEDLVDFYGESYKRGQESERKNSKSNNFKNTLEDLKVCLNNINTNLIHLSHEENLARWELIKICADIVRESGDEVGLYVEII